MKKVISLAAMVIAVSAAGFLPTQAISQVNINIGVPQPPPPMIVETSPAARTGYLWAPGYWNWNGSRFVWAAGHWERLRSQYIYEEPQWRQESDGWHFNRGGWKRGKHKGRHDEGLHRGENRDREDDGGRGDGGHCPPGQAKKGNC